MDNIIDPRQELNFLIDDDTTVAIATTVYIIKDGKVLLMRQTKPNSVVDKYYVGVGGKTAVKTYLGTYKEKNGYDAIVSSILGGKLEGSEPMKDVAVREVKEEIGLTLSQDKLEDIGTTEVRLLNGKTNEMWYISNYIYYADGTEGEITECNEGTLELIPVSDLQAKPMLPHDRIILGEKKPTTHIQSMCDDIHNLKQLRIYQKRQGQGIYILLPNIQSKPYDARGIITEETEEIPEEYKVLTRNVPEEKIREYLKMLGISERVVGTFDKDSLPIDMDGYII